MSEQFVIKLKKIIINKQDSLLVCGSVFVIMRNEMFK